MIVLDTSVLSLVFRRSSVSADSKVRRAYHKLVSETAQVGVPGIVMQELLSGVRLQKQFDELRYVMMGFELLLADVDHYIDAAMLLNRCSKRGIACSTPDALIAALTIAENAELFTTDDDFQRLTMHESLRLFDFISYAGD
jgi:predicted nucleic acid-binding protein